MDSDCSNESSTEVVSPDGTKKIILFSRNCGATTGFNTQGSILERTDTLPDCGGSTFIIDQGTAKASWVNNSNIIITLESSARVIKKKPSDHGIFIEYQTR
jgi:hypothetical protein